MRLRIVSYAILATTAVAFSAAAQGAAAAPPADPPSEAAGEGGATDSDAGEASEPGDTASTEAPPPPPPPPPPPNTTVAAGTAGTTTATAQGTASLPPPPPPPPPPPGVDMAAKKTFPSFKFYGHARLDVAYATQRMAQAQWGLWALSPSSTGGDDNEDVPEFIMYPRWTRLGVDVAVAEPAEGVSVTAKVEVDFQNHHTGASESRATPRLRHAYGQVAMGDLTILAGQTWDLFAPLIYGSMEQAIFWYGGNLGDRRAQLRATYAPKFGDAQLVIAGAAAQSGVVDMADVDADGVNDGVDAAYPAVQGLIELKMALTDEEGAKPLRVGISGYRGAKRIDIAGEDEEFGVLAGVAHLEVPVSILTLRAEGYLGENLRDVRGGIGQGIELRDTDGDEVVDEGKSIPAKGGFVQLDVAPIAWYTLQLGMGVDNPKGINPGGRGLNQTVHVGNTFKPYKSIIIGAVYDYYRTEYVGDALDDGISHRLCAYTMVPF